MTILRKQQRKTFVVVDSEIVRDVRLSFGALGLGTYLLDKPDDWHINIRAIVNERNGATSYAVKQALRELADLGYMMRSRETDSRGRLRTVTVIADWPAFADVGTPESRLNGYGYDENPDDTDDSKKVRKQHVLPGKSDETPTPRNADPRCSRPSVNSGVIPKTDHTEDISNSMVGESDLHFSDEKCPLSTPSQNPVKEKKHKQPSPLTPSAEVVGEDQPAAGREPSDWVLKLEALCWVCFGHKDISALTDAKRGALTAEAKRIFAAYTVDDLRTWYTELWKADWRGKNGDRPTPATVREMIPALKDEEAKKERQNAAAGRSRQGSDKPQTYSPPRTSKYDAAELRAIQEAARIAFG